MSRLQKNWQVSFFTVLFFLVFMRPFWVDINTICWWQLIIGQLCWCFVEPRILLEFFHQKGCNNNGIWLAWSGVLLGQLIGVGISFQGSLTWYEWASEREQARENHVTVNWYLTYTYLYLIFIHFEPPVHDFCRSGFS